MRNTFGLLLREEIHSARMLNKPGDLVRIKRNDRLSIIKYFVNELALMQDLGIINVVVDKVGKENDFDVLGTAWKALVQRFSNTMSSRNLLVANLVEDLYFKDSEKSYLIQAADVAAFVLYQKICPSTFMKKKSGHNFFKRLNGVLCTVASSRDPEGIVWL